MDIMREYVLCVLIHSKIIYIILSAGCISLILEFTLYYLFCFYFII